MKSDKDARIRERAYAIWMAEGQQHGKDAEHWHRAAQQIAQEDGRRAPVRRTAAAAVKALRSGGATGTGRAAAKPQASAKKPGTAKPRRGNGARAP